MKSVNTEPSWDHNFMSHMSHPAVTTVKGELSSCLIPVAWDSHRHWAFETFFFQLKDSSRVHHACVSLKINSVCWGQYIKDCLAGPRLDLKRKGNYVSCKTSNVESPEPCPPHSLSLTRQASGRWLKQADCVSFLHFGRATTPQRALRVHHGLPLWQQVYVSPALFKFSLDCPI